MLDHSVWSGKPELNYLVNYHHHRYVNYFFRIEYMEEGEIPPWTVDQVETLGCPPNATSDSSSISPEEVKMFLEKQGFPVEDLNEQLPMPQIPAIVKPEEENENSEESRSTVQSEEADLPVVEEKIDAKEAETEQIVKTYKVSATYSINF